VREKGEKGERQGGAKICQFLKRKGQQNPTWLLSLPPRFCANHGFNSLSRGKMLVAMLKGFYKKEQQFVKF